RKAIAGTATTVASRLRDVARELDLEELVVVTWTHDAAARRRSYELIAQAFDLANSARLTA
ncbi:MAG TPA: LLM class flavin-dependent oxidoreductase, partial [Acidimicrobiia bacterium]|nr:LLM class flavin-dependent oxidoreductase [Acidimicrobiia bacterium]